MRKNAKRILSVFLTALMLVVVVIPVHALPVPGTLYETTDFYNSIYTAFLKWKVDHPDSEYPGFNPGGMFGGGASRDELKQKYDSYVATLPATGYDSSGSITWSPKIEYWGVVGGSTLVMARCPHVPDSVWSPEDSNQITSFNCSDYSVSVRPALGVEQIKLYVPKVHIKDIYPIDGYYERLQTPFSVGSYINSRSETKPYNISYFRASSELKYAGNTIEYNYYPDYSSSDALFYSIQVYSPVYKITPFNPSGVGDTYNINTRPTSITGGNYGIVGDNGQITKVEDNSTIINETNNTYYNPATGQTVPITSWTYDYSDRSYKVTLESGDTVTVTYGDENITIQEGDTIYNVYYLIDGSGSVTPPCEHDWQKGEATVPTCVRPGSASYVCSKCQQTKTETIPALGHNWQVKQTVTTQYDEEGNLIQQGYTIFECSRCHEQYKSTDGTIPPGGGSGTDPGGEEGETTIGGLIEKLLSGVGSVVGGIIKGLLSLLTKAVEAIAGITDLFTTFVSSLVSLWGGFTSFLSAVFPFLPEEFVIIIELGLILMIAAAVFRKFIS